MDNSIEFLANKIEVIATEKERLRNNLNNVIETQEKEIREKTKKIQELKKVVDLYDSNGESVLGANEAIIRNLKKKVGCLTAEKEGLKMTVAALDKSDNFKSNEIKEYKMMIDNKNETLNNIVRQCELKNKNIDNLDQEVRELRVVIYNKDMSLQNNCNKINDLKEENKGFQDWIKDLNLKIKNFQAEVTDLNKYVNQLKEVNGDLRKEIEVLKDTVKRNKTTLDCIHQNRGSGAG